MTLYLKLISAQCLKDGEEKMLYIGRAEKPLNVIYTQPQAQPNINPFYLCHFPYLHSLFIHIPLNATHATNPQYLYTTSIPFSFHLHLHLNPIPSHPISSPPPLFPLPLLMLRIQRTNNIYMSPPLLPSFPSHTLHHHKSASIPIPTLSI